MITRYSGGLHIVPILPDELLASWLLRITLRRHRSFGVLAHAIGTKRMNYLSYGPNVMSRIVKTFAPSLRLSTRVFVEEHSVLSIFRPLVSEAVWTRLLSHRDGLRSDAHARFRCGPLVPLHINLVKICPICRRIDARKGFLFYRVSNNLPITRYCPKHGCSLVGLLRPERRIEDHHQSLDELHYARSLAASKATEKLHQQLSRDLFWLLRTKSNISVSCLRYRFKVLLHKRGAPIDSESIRKAMICHFGNEFFSELGYRTATSLHQLMRLLLASTSRPDPIVAVLAARALGSSIRTLVSNRDGRYPKQTLWSCPNRHSECYGMSVIRIYKPIPNGIELQCPVCKIRFRTAYQHATSSAASIEYVLPTKRICYKIVAKWGRQKRVPDIERLARITHVDYGSLYGVVNAYGLRLERRSANWSQELSRLRSLIRDNPCATPDRIMKMFGYAKFHRLRSANISGFFDAILKLMPKIARDGRSSG